MKQKLLFIPLASIIILISACAKNPVTGKRQVVLMTEEQELSMGREADPQIIQQFGLYEDQNLQNFINEKGKEMVAVSHRNNIPYEFRIVDSEVLNAFAVPGGYVYFTRGIMAHFNNEAEFAGVLGHEIGHIAARHSVEQQRNAILGQLGIIAGIIIAPDLAQFAEPASQGLGLLLLKFGRNAERESDRLGVEYSTKIGYDAQQMANFFNTLERKQAAAGGEELPDFLSTHPNPGDRNATVSQLAREWKQKVNLTNPKVNRDVYLRRIDGLIYGEDPKGGFLENNVFYHPVLRFQYATPQNWAYQNTPQRVQFAPQDGKAVMFLTLAPGKSLQEAANAVLQQNSLQALDSREITVNGLRAISIVADQRVQQTQQQQQQQQQPQVRTLIYLIQHGENIYLHLGATRIADFNYYSQIFTNSFQSFRELTDSEKINRKPERVRIKTVNQSATLDQVLRSYRVSDNKRLEEHALLNGMKLTDRVNAGTLIKVIERG